ncbi:MAG: mechanosensitive ion channel family protein [Oryzomonas sp.]|uniref:mechanosensitive ion channel family protein n=1 Tax=Oryzomonas sp. TaxID=2855186 RepID=UPI002848D1DF|nr:mechanosensitive ion channel family protein [Oryzomonas sp.]MDR3578727.1 mechanosensitive ion channel family protein [Oryzomonas sp.]
MNSRILSFVQALFRPQGDDGPILFWAKEILGALLILAFFWMLAQLIVLMLNKWGKRLAAFTNTDLNDRLLQRVIPHVSRLLIMLGVYLAILSLPLHEKLVVILSGILFIAMVAIVFVLIYHAFDELLQWYIAGQQHNSGALISLHMIPIAEKTAMLFLMGTALLVILKHFQYDIFSLITALGIGSLAIGLAAKDTLANMISGFTLMLDRPFRIGDRIQLVGGQVGDVGDIGLRSTKIRTLDNQLLIIPNSDLCNTMLINQAFPDVRAKGCINIGVAYGSDVDRVKEILVSAALEVEDVLRDPAPEAYFVSFGDSALNMSLFFWVQEYSQLFSNTDKVNSLIIRRFNENGIEIPFPIRTVIMEPLAKRHEEADILVR